MQTAAIQQRLLMGLPAEMIRENEPMASHTTFRIGGPCDLFISPETEEQIVFCIQTLRQMGVPMLVMGNGSNMLVRDGGVRACVVKINSSGAEIQVDRQAKTLYAGAGESMMAIANRCIQEGLTGQEFASGIPGTLGGAVMMNAGAYEHEIGEIIQSVRVLTKEGEVREVSQADMRFGYRTSAATTNQWVVLGATLQLQQAEPEQVKAKVADFTRRRRAKQPLMYASAGSTFKRPQGHFAAKLIDDAGLKGARVGQAQVSEMHAGFVINRGGASAKDVLALMAQIQQTVQQRFGVALQPEVKIIGED